MENVTNAIPAEIAEREFKKKVILGSGLERDIPTQKFSVKSKGQGRKALYFNLHLEEEDQRAILLVRDLEGSPAFQKSGEEYFLNDKDFLIQGVKGGKFTFTK